MRELAQLATHLALDVLVEVHDAEELEQALMLDVPLIGINNRNLNDFSVDINTTFRLQQLIPAEIPVVSESGLKTAGDLTALARAGVSAALIGESLMRAGTGSSLLSELRVGGDRNR